jgi:TonB family protein
MNNHLKSSILLIIASITLGGTLSQAAPATADIKAPKALQIVEPEVPVNYIRWGVPGQVVVSFQINDNGETEYIRIEDADDRLYASRVEEAVRKWRFEKPEIAGVTYRQAINFSHKRGGRPID